MIGLVGLLGIDQLPRLPQGIAGRERQTGASGRKEVSIDKVYESRYKKTVRDMRFTNAAL